MVLKIDPRTKMLIAFSISCLSVIYNTPKSLFTLFIVTAVILCFFRIKSYVILRVLRPLFIYMLLILFMVQCLFVRSGKVLLHLGDFTFVTSDGLMSGTQVVLRILVLVAIALIFTTLKPGDFILGLVQCKIPYEIAFMVTLAIRFLPLFKDEAQNVVIAVQLRGVELKKVSLKKRVDLYSRLFFPMIYASLFKARQMSVALETRGFRLYPKRTYMRRLKFGIADYIIMLICFSSTLTLIIAF